MCSCLLCNGQGNTANCLCVYRVYVFARCLQMLDLARNYVDRDVAIAIVEFIATCRSGFHINNNYWHI